MTSMTPSTPSAHPQSRKDDPWKRFATVVAHDLKEPLRNVSSCARMLVSLQGDENPEVKQYCEWLIESSERIDGMVEGLLEHARIGHEAQTELDMGEVLQEVVRDLRCLTRRTESTIEIGPMPQIKAGPLGIRLLFINLIENAMKYGRVGVPLVVEVSSTATPEGHIFEVRDNGKGMTRTERATAFDPGRRYDLSVKGLGMGLSHVWKIIHGHQGWITVESEPGEGTRFIFFIPD